MLTAKDWLIILSSAGFLLSMYSAWVDGNLRKIVRYKPACDINNNISCSKVFNSRYGRLLGFSNAYLGLAGYALVFVLTSFEMLPIVNVLAFISVALSIILAYWSYIKLRIFCLVCTLTYLINIALLFVSYRGLV